MTFDQFITKYTNKYVDFDGYYGYQCMDLMHQYIKEVLGQPDPAILRAPTANLVYKNFPNVGGSSLFTKINNTPTGVPQKGDILFWGTKLGPAGHVAVFVDGNVNKLRSFDQNFPIGSKCHIQGHDYNGMLGWLRFKVQPVDKLTQIRQVVYGGDNDADARYKIKQILG